MNKRSKVKVRFEKIKVLIKFLILAEKIKTCLKKFFTKLETKIMNFNIYNKNSRDLTRIYHGLLASRLYVFSLFISTCFIILYSDLSDKIITEKVYNPSQQEYEKLEKEHSSRLICSCTQVSIPYEDIMNIEVSYHQICSSHFIQSWFYRKFSV